MNQKKPERILHRISLAILVFLIFINMLSCKRKKEPEYRSVAESQEVLVVKEPVPVWKTILKHEESRYDIVFSQDGEPSCGADIFVYIREISIKGITYSIVNHSAYSLRYGMAYDLKRMVEKEWVSELEALKGNYYFSDEACYLAPEQEISLTDNFDHPALDQGRYCLIKLFTIVDQNDSAIYSVTINNEFVVK